MAALLFVSVAEWTIVARKSSIVSIDMPSKSAVAMTP